MTLDQKLSLCSLVVAVLGVIVSIILAIIGYRISRKLSAKGKYEHEIYITEQVNKILGKKAILADVKKYNGNNTDLYNASYYKQACGIHHVLQNYGVVVQLRGGGNSFELGLIPFEWIEYIRENDSEDNYFILVCKFKGIKWYKDFKSPIKEILKSGI
ncbi:MAG: hypothetical protein WCO35_02390 [Candidatus Nomurabacteria bacterium]